MRGTTTKGAEMTATPGYGYRIEIFFKADRNGRKVAYHWSARQLRAWRMPLADAEMFIAQDLADEIDGHPMQQASARYAAAVSA